MKIPIDADLPTLKITSYLLVFQETDDKSKFLSIGGFNLKNWQKLETAIRQLNRVTEATYSKSNQYGDFYHVNGKLKGVNNIDLPVTTVWLEQNNKFRFITLIPRK